MTEAKIREYAREYCKKNEWVCWFPARVRYYENDVFGIGDMLLIEEGILKIVQLTTLSNLAARRKKIKEFLKKVDLISPVQIWAVGRKKREIVMKIEDAKTGEIMTIKNINL